MPDKLAELPEHWRDDVRVAEDLQWTSAMPLAPDSTFVVNFINALLVNGKAEIADGFKRVIIIELE